MGWGWLSQTRPIPRSPDGDKNPHDMDSNKNQQKKAAEKAKNGKEISIYSRKKKKITSVLNRACDFAKMRFMFRPMCKTLPAIKSTSSKLVGARPRACSFFSIHQNIFPFFFKVILPQYIFVYQHLFNSNGQELLLLFARDSV